MSEKKIKNKEKMILYFSTSLCIFGFFFTNISPNYAQGNKANMNSLQLEISEVQLNKSAKVDITPLVKKYIPVGMPEAQARDILKSAGFQIYEINNKLKSPSFLAIWIYKKELMSQREARVAFKSSESKITSIAGDVIYQSI